MFERSIRRELLAKMEPVIAEKEREYEEEVKSAVDRFADGLNELRVRLAGEKEAARRRIIASAFAAFQGR